MNKKAVSGIMLTLLLLGALTFAFSVLQVKAEPGKIIVPDDYPTIQKAIDAANPGDTIYIRYMTYHENVLVNKPLTLIGGPAIIDGVISVEANNVSISRLVTDPQWFPCGGVFLDHVSNCRISEMLMDVDELCGIHLVGSSNNVLAYNIVVGLVFDGIVLDHSSNNMIVGNNVTVAGRYGISLVHSSGNVLAGNSIAIDYWAGWSIGLYKSLDNKIYHNNFVNSKYGQIDSYESVNIWDDGYPSGGNYWGDYIDNDTYSGLYQNETGSDGIGDTPYIIDKRNQDNYPLMQLYHGSIRNLDTGRSYPTIQKGINSASEGDRVFVLSGTYYEHVVINKTVSLIGENRYVAIIDGNGTLVTILHVKANNVTIRGFTIQNDAPIHCLEGGGIYITDSNRTNIVDNMITQTQYPINLRNSAGNTIVSNTIIKNDVGLQFLDSHSSNSTIYHNNFLNNSLQVSNFGASNNWDNGCEGNYWSNYNGTDLDGDGVGDTELPWEGVDYYPLMNRYGNPGDVNHDLKVDIYDVVRVCSAYGSQVGDEHWNPHCDLAQPYGIINIHDVVIVCANYDKEYQ